MNPRPEDFYGELDELELGERVADYLFDELAGSMYTTMEDRAWCIVGQCYRAMVTAVGPEHVPPKWTPSFDNPRSPTMP